MSHKKDQDIVLIAAVSRNNVIGVEGKIPWRIKEDMDHFRNFNRNREFQIAL